MAVNVQCDIEVSSALSCCWPISIDEGCCPEAEALEQERVDQLGQIVSSMLLRWSGYQVGLCQAQIRPLHECSYCRTWCCGSADGIRLDGPNGMRVADVLAVYAPNELLLTDYHFDSTSQTLYRTPPDKWPARDAKHLPLGEPGTFGVDVVVGSPPDEWALWVAEQLFCELAKSCRGGKCRIPKNAIRVDGQGISVAVSENELKHMIPEVMAWVGAVNPAGATVPARVFSPEVARRGTRVTGGLYGVRGCCG